MNLKRRASFRATIIFCRWGPIRERRNGGETPGASSTLPFANLWTHCDLPRIAERVYRAVIDEKKLLSSRKILHSPRSSLSLSRYLRSSSAHVRQKGARFRKAKRKRKAFPLSRKKILRTAPPSPPKRTGIPKYHAIFNAGNVEFENWCSNDSSHGLKEPRVSPR